MTTAQQQKSAVRTMEHAARRQTPIMTKHVAIVPLIVARACRPGEMTNFKSGNALQKQAIGSLGMQATQRLLRRGV